jgi:hypothetical protein
MGLLKDLLHIDADRRAASEALRGDASQRRLKIESLSAESKARRDEIQMLQQGLLRLADDLAAVEQEIVGLDRKREDVEVETAGRKVAAVRAVLAAEREDGIRVASDFRALRASFHAEREKLLAQADTGRMMDNFFQIETFLKDAGHPIPDAARRALVKERQDLLARIGPLVAPPPSPDGVFRATLVYSGIEAGSGRAVVAFALPDEKEADGPADLPSLLLYGAWASAVERLGPGAPRPARSAGIVLFEASGGSRSPEDVALDLLIAVEEGLKKAAAAGSVRCELTSVFVEPAVAAAVFPPAA